MKNDKEDMKASIDTILKHALSPTDEPNFKLNQKILNRVRERELMNNTKSRRISTVVLTAVLVLSLCSVTAFAAWKYLSPTEVAQRGQDNNLAKAFESKEAIIINETQVFEDYKISLLGAVSGGNISKYMDKENAKEVEQSKTYTVVAIEKTDGTDMPSSTEESYGEHQFFVSPLIQGQNPNQYNIASMGGGYSEFVQDGILYRLTQCDNVEVFADRQLYLCVNSGTFFEQKGYLYNEKSGEITKNESYKGINALFGLPIPKEKADPKAAATYLKELHASWNEKGDEPGASEVDIWVSKLTPENISELAEVVKETVYTGRADKDGMLHYSYEYEGGSGSGDVMVSEVFPNQKSGMSSQFSYSYDDRGLEGLTIQTFTLNEDGTVTFALYIPK